MIRDKRNWTNYEEDNNEVDNDKDHDCDEPTRMALSQL